MARRHPGRAGHRPVGQLTFKTTETDRQGEWTVIAVPPGAARKTYRCPGCNQEIPPGTAHRVAWRADEPDGLDDRRHWHSPCWTRRARRR